MERCLVRELPLSIRVGIVFWLFRKLKRKRTEVEPNVQAGWPQNSLEVQFLMMVYSQVVRIKNWKRNHVENTALFQSSHFEDEKTEAKVEEVACPKTCF